MTAIIRTPVRLQGNPAECGAVCLGIVLEHYGIYLPALELRARCSVNRDGATIAQIQRGAQSLGYDCNVFKKGIESLRQTEMPLILHWNMSHFVVLEGIRGDVAWINDPGIGRRRMTVHELGQYYTGICLLMSPCDVEVNLSQSQPQSLWDFLPEHLKRFHVFFWLGLIPGLLLFATELLLGGLSRAFFDYVVDHRMVKWGYVLALIGVPLIAFKSLISHMQTKQMNRIELNLATRLKEFFLQRLFEKPIAYIEAHYAGELISRSLDTERFLRFSFRLASGLGEQIVIIFFSIVVVVIMSPLIALINLVPCLILLVWSFYLQAPLKELSIRSQQEEGRYQTFLVQRLESYQRFFVTGMQMHLLATCLPSLARLQSARADLKRCQMMYHTATATVSVVVPPVTTFAGSYLLIQGELSYGGFMLASVLSVLLIKQLEKVSEACRQYAELKPITRRAAEVFMDTRRLLPPPRIVQPPVAVDPDILLQATGIYYGYNGIDADLFAGANLNIYQGEVVCLTGPSGSGKTTFMELLSGQRDLIAGQVRFAGVLLEGAAPCGFVFADDVFVEGPLNRFISGQAHPDLRRVARCLDNVELTERLGFFVGGQGLEKLEEQMLSRGEIQRLMLAQALYHAGGPDGTGGLIFFDEAFSHLSRAQSSRILERLRDDSVAMILASHRSEIHELCDRIVDVTTLSAPPPGGVS